MSRKWPIAYLLTVACTTAPQSSAAQGREHGGAVPTDTANRLADAGTIARRDSIGLLPKAARWIARAFGIEDPIYGKLTQVRGDADAILHGTQLRTLDLATGREEVLWPCDDCWSPTPFRDSIAFLSRAGLMVAPMSGKTPQLRFPDSTLVLIIGVPPGRVSDLLVARRARTPDASCDLELVSVDGTTGRATVVPLIDTTRAGPTESCVDLRQLLRAGEVLDDRVITTTITSPDAPEPRGLREGLIRRTGPAVRIDYSEVKPTYPVDPSRRSLERFDPVWISPSRIVYVTRGWP